MKGEKMLEGILIHYSTYPADFGYEAYYEVNDLLEEVLTHVDAVENIDVTIAPDGMDGLLLIDLRDAPIATAVEEKTIAALKSAMKKGKKEGYWEYISKPIFFNHIVDSNPAKIANAVKNLKDQVKGKWRITIKSRHRIPRRKTIDAAAKHIKFPVDLENPKYIVKIECLGKHTGVRVKKVK